MCLSSIPDPAAPCLCLWNIYPWIHNLSPQTQGNSCLPELEQRKHFVPRHSEPNVKLAVLVQCQRGQITLDNSNTFLSTASHIASSLFLSENKQAFMFKFILKKDSTGCCLETVSANLFDHVERLISKQL